MLNIPYGISNYQEIRTEDYLYVDKTRYIEELERLGKYLVFLRPRRFGKTLLVSTLEAYYNINTAERFDELFGDTYIGRHKTKKANQYYVMRFNFSSLNTVTEEDLRVTFYKKVRASLREFNNDYQLGLMIEEDDRFDAASTLNDFLSEIKYKTGKQVYICVDEYDHFANNIIGNQEFFQTITGKDGFVRNFYEVFKAHTENGCIDRIFITGVTSMTLDSLTSGFNIASNVSMVADLNEMVGFTETETKGLLEQMQIPEVEQVIELLRAQYNGYVFSKKVERVGKVYNSNLVLFFLKEYCKEGGIPDTLIDSNIRGDYSKLADMMALYKDEESRTAVLRDIMFGKSVATSIVTNFSFASAFSREEFLSMLFYLGLLTIGGADAFGVELKSPNAVIRDVYYNYYGEYLKLDEKEKNAAMRAVAYHNDFTKFNELIEKILKSHNTDDFRGFDEGRLKSIFLASFSTQEAYLVKSELQSGGRKIDIALIDYRNGSTGVKYNYLIELKYLKKRKKNKKAEGKEVAEAEITEEDIQAARDDARQQMIAYLSLPEFQLIGRTKGMIYVVVKDDIKCFEEVKITDGIL